MTYKTYDYNATGYETKTTRRTVTNQYGHSYQEELKEDVPYSVKRSIDVLIYGNIYFKNTLVQSMGFDFVNKKDDNIVNKLYKLSQKLNIVYKKDFSKGN